LAVTTGVALYGFGSRFLNRRVGVLAMFGFFGAGMVTEVSITTRIDITIAGMLFIATYAMMVYFETENRGWLYASALLSGFSLSIKYTAGAWIALLGVMFVYENLFRKRQKLSLFIKHGLLFSLLMFAVVSPWMLKNYAYYKNPLYPFITGEVADYGPQGIRYFTEADERQMDSYLEQSKKGLPEVTADIEKRMSDTARQRPERHPFRFWEYYTKTELYNMGDADAYHDPNLLFIIIPLLLFLPKPRWLVWLGIFCIAFFCFVASSAWIARYSLPIYPALTLLAAYTLASLADKLAPFAPLAKKLPVIAVGITVFLNAFIFASQMYKIGGVGFLTGALSRRDFVKALYYNSAIDWVNHNTPKDARVLMLGTQMGYHLQRQHLADPAWDSVEWQRLMARNHSFEELHEDLKRQGIQYVVFHPGLFGYIALMGRSGSGPAGTVFSSPAAAKYTPDYYVQQRNWETFELYQSRFLQLVHESNNCFVYKLK
jgi:hypothetical protein